jgi:hypothetical protein
MVRLTHVRNVGAGLYYPQSEAERGLTVQRRWLAGGDTSENERKYGTLTSILSLGESEEVNGLVGPICSENINLFVLGQTCLGPPKGAVSARRGQCLPADEDTCENGKKYRTLTSILSLDEGEEVNGVIDPWLFGIKICFCRGRPPCLPAGGSVCSQV